MFPDNPGLKFPELAGQPEPWIIRVLVGEGGQPGNIQKLAYLQKQ